MLGWIALIFIFVLLVSLAYAAASGAPWVPTWKKDEARILALLDLHDGDVFYELGCGMGGLCLAAAGRPGVRVVGVELSLFQWLVSLTRKFFGRRRNFSVRLGNLFNQDLSSASAVYFFLMPDAYAKLKGKLARELRPGTRVVAYVWPIPGWEAVRTDHVAGYPDLHLYVIGAPGVIRSTAP